mgnify:CR=1 FL=1
MVANSPTKQGQKITHLVDHLDFGEVCAKRRKSNTTESSGAAPPWASFTCNPGTPGREQNAPRLYRGLPLSPRAGRAQPGHPFAKSASFFFDRAINRDSFNKGPGTV